MRKDLTTIRNTALAWLLLGAAPALACQNYDAVVAAVQDKDRAAAATLYEAIATDPACTDDLRDWTGRFLAREHFRDSLTDGATDADREAALSQALSYERHWRTYAELGRISWGAKDYTEAAKRFQLALEELGAGDPSHEAQADEISEIHQLASAAMALADEVVEVPKTRSGEAGGVFRTKYRGFQVEEVPLPITFVYDSTEFDKTGQHYADALLDHVLSVQPAELALDGHTDPSGSESYNADLSYARAEAVRLFLRQNGFEGKVTIRGLGESQVPTPPPGIEEGSEEHFRIARRVAFRIE